jgi:RNA polymerase sigma-70 factor (ECF subfamily)
VQPQATDFPSAYRRFLAPVRLKCRRLLGESGEAEDAAHESFVRLLQVGPVWTSERDTPQVMGWLYRTCTRLCIDVLRRRRHVEAARPHDDQGGDDDTRPVLPGGASLEDALAARRLVTRLCGRVSGAELEAAVLCRVDGLSQTEAATVLGVTDRTVRRLLERFDEATALLRKEFAS